VTEQLTSAGWQAPELRELNDEYAAWYTSLVERIEQARDRITDIAGERGFDHVLKLYRGLLNAARNKKLGATIIRTTPAL